MFERLRGAVRRCFGWLPGPSLDGNPLLWREWWHARQSRWLGAYWALYIVGMMIATAMALLEFLKGKRVYPSLIPCASFGTGFGLLAVAVRSAAAWSEERAAGPGGLDVLLSTPLSAAEIVRGKWWACYRAVLGVAIVPILAAVILAAGAPTLPLELTAFSPPVGPMPLRLVNRVAVALVVIGQPLLFGAAVVSLGLWLATRFSRTGRAVVWSVVAYMMVALAWPLFEEIFLMRRIDRNLSEGLAAASPIAAATVTLMPMYSPWYGTARYVVPYAAAWLVVAAIIAIGLRWWTVRKFDRWMGQMRPDALSVPVDPHRAAPSRSGSDRLLGLNGRMDGTWSEPELVDDPGAESHERIRRIHDGLRHHDVGDHEQRLRPGRAGPRAAPTPQGRTGRIRTPRDRETTTSPIARDLVPLPISRMAAAHRAEPGVDPHRALAESA